MSKTPKKRGKMIITEKKQKINDASEMVNVLRSILNTEDEISREREHFWVVGLNAKNVIQYIELCSLGTLTSSLIHPRETFRLAVFKGVASIVALHSHPSNDVTPSREDIVITERLSEAGDVLGIKLLDHIIIGDGYCSMLEKGYIK